MVSVESDSWFEERVAFPALARLESLNAIPHKDFNHRQDSGV